jgi:hypothetical protein
MPLPHTLIYITIYPMRQFLAQSASNELKASLVLPEDGMPAVRTIVRLIQAGVHHERQAAAQRTHAEEDETAPEVGRITALLIHDCRN